MRTVLRLLMEAFQAVALFGFAIAVRAALDGISRSPAPQRISR
jgi:hypothetical protein